jgi:energy-coupling factor transport system ATP-binding protein
MITCDHLSYRYPDAPGPALDSVSLTVRPGERLAVMGPNGSGKSTFGRLLAGLLTPTGGQVRIESHSSETARADQVGMLFQNPDNQMVSVLVDKEVAFALENRAVPMTGMKPRVAEMLAMFGISHLAKRLTSQLSGGEKQRVALASVMICNPPILLLDEPDSYLDAAGRRLLRDVLARLHDTYPNLIEIRVTQYLEIARAYPRLLVFGEGELQADGPPARILADPERAARLGLVAVVQGSDRTASVTKQPVAIAALELDTVSFAFARTKTPVLSKVSLQIRAGEKVAVVGPTGAGKSTLGLLLTGLYKPTEGALRRRENPEYNGPKHMPISAVFQQPERQFFLPTCAEEIAYGPKAAGRVMTQTRIERYLDLAGLEPLRFADRDPLSLSVGEKRRLAFAVVLALEPDFVLFDEPTAGLDPDGVARFQALAHTQAQAGKGVIFITHERQLVERLADRVWVVTGNGSVADLAPVDFLAGPQYRTLVSDGELD